MSSKNLNYFDQNFGELLRLVEAIRCCHCDHDREGKGDDMSSDENIDFDQDNASDDDTEPIDVLQEMHTHVDFLV